MDLSRVPDDDPLRRPRLKFDDISFRISHIAPSYFSAAGNWYDNYFSNGCSARLKDCLPRRWNILHGKCNMGVSQPVDRLPPAFLLEVVLEDLERGSVRSASRKPEMNSMEMDAGYSRACLQFPAG